MHPAGMYRATGVLRLCAFKWLIIGSRALTLGAGLAYQPSQILLCGIRLRVGVVNYGVLLQLGQLVNGLKVAHGAGFGTHDHGAGRSGGCTVGNTVEHVAVGKTGSCNVRSEEHT